MSSGLFIWAPVLLAAVWAAHWGAEHLSEPLKKLRRQWGFSVAAGGAFVGLAAASPEIGINTTSAIRGVGDIGLGALLGSNVLAIPMMVLTAYLATRKKGIGGAGEHRNHEKHRREHLLQVDRQAVTVQALPYLGIIALFALLALPAPWRGLQPIDGWVLLIGYLAYLVQALLRGREEGEWRRKEKWKAAAGIGALAVGAYFTVFATERIVSAVGLSKIIGGLFITAPVAALPEVFATWYVARSGQVTSGVTSVIGDHVVTMTLAFIPLTIVGMPIENMQLFWVALAFVTIMPALYAGFIWWGGRDTGFKRWQVLMLPAVYAAFVAAIVFWVQPFGQGAQGGSGGGSAGQGQQTSPEQNSDRPGN
jgi:cation:H+ antiporter